MFMKGTYAWNLRVSQTNEGYCHVQTSMHHLLFLHMGKIAEEHDFGGDANCVPASLSLNLILTFCDIHIFKLSIFTSPVFTPAIFPKIFIFHLKTQIFSLPFGTNSYQYQYWRDLLENYAFIIFYEYL